MLPLDQPWYRRLLGWAFALGLAGAVLGLGYLAVTGAGIDLLFGDAGFEPWSGEWWWIPLIAAGGLVVASLRNAWAVPEHIPGAIEAIESAAIDHRTAPHWVAISAVSLILGASLGPSFALVIMGGAAGSWLAQRRWAEGRADVDYTLTGMAGSLGGLLTAPILGAFMVSELAPTPRQRYVASIIPQLVAASIGFAVFYVIIGRTFLGIYRLPPYRFELSDMVIAVVLGVAAVVVMAVFVAVSRLVGWITDRIRNRYVLGLLGGAGVGLIAVALPLTLASGNTQLETVIREATTIGVGLLVAALLAKMVAVAISVSVGFIGGNVFPMIFIGGTSGVIVSLLVPGVPASLAVAAMMAAVPGAVLRAPISLTVLAAMTVGLGPRTVAPVAVSVSTAYLVAATVRHVVSSRRPAESSR